MRRAVAILIAALVLAVGIEPAAAWNGKDRVGRFADISQYQPPNVVSWDRYAKEQPLVVLRASYGGGLGDYDRAFPTHFKRARRAGVEVIAAYHFAYPDGNDAEAEARNFVARARAGGMRAKGRRAKLRRRHEAFILDYELVGRGVDDDKWVNQFRSEFRRLTKNKAGRYPRLWLYGYGSPLNQLQGSHGMPVWFAAYTNDWMPYWPGRWAAPKVSDARPVAWQYTNGSTGRFPHRLPGLGVNHDVSVALGRMTVRELRKLAS